VVQDVQTQNEEPEKAELHEAQFGIDEPQPELSWQAH